MAEDTVWLWSETWAWTLFCGILRFLGLGRELKSNTVLLIIHRSSMMNCCRSILVFYFMILVCSQAKKQFPKKKTSHLELVKYVSIQDVNKSEVETFKFNLRLVLIDISLSQDDLFFFNLFFLIFLNCQLKMLLPLVVRQVLLWF